MSSDLPTRFYTAFAARDHATMNACYAPDATFRDPVFDLRGEDVQRMWTALCTNARDFSLTFDVHASTDTSAQVTWEARYTFSATGRSVHNVVTTEMDLADGSIVAQRDDFNFHRWATQALGLPGRLLGWFPPFQRAVASRAARTLGL